MKRHKSIIVSLILSLYLAPNIKAGPIFSKEGLIMRGVRVLTGAATVEAVKTAAEECTTMVTLAQPGMELVASKFGESIGKYAFVGTMQYVGAQSQAVIATLSAKAVAAKAMSVAIYASPLTPYIVAGTVTTYVATVGVVHTYYYFNPSTNMLIETTKQNIEEAELKLKLRKIEITREQVEIQANVDKAKLNTQFAANQSEFIKEQAKLKILQQAQAVSPQQVITEARKIAPAMAKL